MDTSATPTPVVTPPHPPKKAELAGKPLPSPDYTHPPAQHGVESPVHTVGGTESGPQQNGAAGTPSGAHLNTMQVLQRIQQQQLQFQQQQQKRQQQQEPQQQEQTMLNQLHTPTTQADRSPSSHAPPDSHQGHPPLSPPHPESVPAAATALSSLQLLMQPGYPHQSTTSTPPTTHTHPDISASHGSVGHERVEVDSFQGPHRPPKPSHLKANPLPSPFPTLPASGAYVDTSAVTADLSGGGGGGGGGSDHGGGEGEGRGGGGGGGGGLVEEMKGESLERSLTEHPPFIPSVPEAVHGSVQVSTPEPRHDHTSLPLASLPQNVPLPEQVQTLALNQPHTAPVGLAEPSAPYYNPNINIQPGEITQTTSCILGPIPSPQAVPTSPEASTTLTSTHLMATSHKILSGELQPTVPALPVLEVPVSEELIPIPSERSTALSPPASTPQPIQQAPPPQSPPNPPYTDTQSSERPLPGSIPVDSGGGAAVDNNQQPSSTTPAHAEAATEINGPDANQEVTSSAEVVLAQTLQSLSQSEPPPQVSHAVSYDDTLTTPSNASVTSSTVQNLPSLNPSSGQRLIQGSSTPLLGAVGMKPLTDLPRVMPLSMTTLASLDLETPTPSTSLAGELPVGAMSLQLSALMAPQLQLLQHSVEEQKSVIEVQREEIEMHKSQIAEYRQQVSQLQQQLSVLQQKQDHEKATASGQQNALMQLLQQQQGIFSQQQVQIEKLSTHDETHRKEYMEVEARYRETMRNEQEMKSSLQSQNLQLMQENQKLNQVIQTQSHQVQTLQLQLQQYSVHIQERDKQLLAFKDQHKQIVDKQEEKHKQKITQFLQRLQDHERGQSHDGGTSLPHPLQPVVMLRNPQNNLDLGPTISRTNLPPPMQPNISRSHAEKALPPLQHQGSISRALTSPLQQISSQPHLPVATPVTLPMHPPSSQPIQQHGVQSPQQHNVPLMRQPILQTMQSYPPHQIRPSSTGPVPARPPSTGPHPVAAVPPSSSPAQWTGYGGGAGNPPPSQTAHPPPQSAPIRPQQQQQQAHVLPQAQYTRGPMQSNIQPGGAQQHAVPPNVQHGGGATMGHFTPPQPGPNGPTHSGLQAPSVSLATRPRLEAQASYPGQSFPQSAGITPQQPTRFVGGPDGQTHQYRPVTPQQAMISPVPQSPQVFPQRFSAGPLGQNLPPGPPLGQVPVGQNFPQGAPPGQILPQTGLGGQQYRNSAP